MDHASRHSFQILHIRSIIQSSQQLIHLACRHFGQVVGLHVSVGNDPIHPQRKQYACHPISDHCGLWIPSPKDFACHRRRFRIHELFGLFSKYTVYVYYTVPISSAVVRCRKNGRSAEIYRSVPLPDENYRRSLWWVEAKCGEYNAQEGKNQSREGDAKDASRRDATHRNQRCTVFRDEWEAIARGPWRTRWIRLALAS